MSVEVAVTSMLSYSFMQAMADPRNFRAARMTFLAECRIMAGFDLTYLAQGPREANRGG